MPLISSKFSPNSTFRPILFSIYLWQLPLYKVQGTLPIGLALLLLLILIAITSYYVIEEPMRKFINNKWAPNRELIELYDLKYHNLPQTCKPLIKIKYNREY